MRGFVKPLVLFLRWRSWWRGVVLRRVGGTNRPLTFTNARCLFVSHTHWPPFTLSWRDGIREVKDATPRPLVPLPGHLSTYASPRPCVTGQRGATIDRRTFRANGQREGEEDNSCPNLGEKGQPVNVNIVNPPIQDPWRTQGDYLDDQRRARSLYRVAVASVWRPRAGARARPRRPCRPPRK